MKLADALITQPGSMLDASICPGSALALLCFGRGCSHAITLDHAELVLQTFQDNSAAACRMTVASPAALALSTLMMLSQHAQQ